MVLPGRICCVFRPTVRINFSKYSRFLRLISSVALCASLSTRKCKCASTVAGDEGATSTRCGARALRCQVSRRL
ncbi:hypothetical protein E2C01_027892 [Portunus trituberculatus]|uniref:Uncharacterized protein n=1 Tax=Portunus trituberculatus TaxID=210409 RepID=A0A5B7EJ35_PORTR|nr:hypothetical protein [Portunus trituberculatus]